MSEVSEVIRMTRQVAECARKGERECGKDVAVRSSAWGSPAVDDVPHTKQIRSNSLGIFFIVEQLLKIQALLKRNSKPTALYKPSWIFNQLHREEGTVSTVPYIVWREKKNIGEKELSKNEI